MSNKNSNYNNRKKKRSFNDFNSNQSDYNNNNWNYDKSSSSPYKKRKSQYNENHNNSNNKQNVNRKNEEFENVLSLIKCNKPRRWTVSIALPGSVMSTAKTPQLQTYLASQFARIISIFCIDEIIIFSETATTKKEEPFKSDDNLFLFRLLQYLETPQYLRRLLFPVHNDFRYVGICKPLRTPHHLGRNEMSPYREGIVLKRTMIHPKVPKITNLDNTHNTKWEKKKKKKKVPKLIKNMEKNKGNDNIVSIVSIGLNKQCIIDKKLEEDTRITVQIENYQDIDTKDEEYYFGKVVNPSTPMEKDGIYWGYKTRFADDIGDVISSSIYKNGYDLIIGTSDKGDSVYNEAFNIPKFKHLLIVFGGPNGLESCVLNKGNDGKPMKLNKPRLLFDQYINVCPYQGTRTIRSEEALLMTLSVLQPHLQNNYDL